MKTPTLKLVPALGLLAALSACGQDETESFECEADKDLWEQCTEGEVRWCHAVGTPHFHSGAKCELSGLTCTEISESRAVCTDPSVTCNPGEFRCDGNSAINCIDGLAAIRPCGTLKVCLADQAAGLATCFDDRPEAPCSGHGDLYETGCVCDRGYTRNGETCVAG